MITTKIAKITKRGSRFFYLKYLRVRRVLRGSTYLRVLDPELER